jgi:hypothetical protein
MLLDGGRQAFCGNESCEVMTWNPTQTREELEADKKEIFLPKTKGRRGLLIQPTGELEFRDIDGLDDMHAAIGSDNLDWAAPGPLNYICYGYALYERPYNPVATGLYRGTHPDYPDPLCGPVLVLGPAENENETDISEEFIRLAYEIRHELGPQEIARLAVPLSDQERMMVAARMREAQERAKAALSQGRAVDFGGIMVGPEDAVARAAQAATTLSSEPQRSWEADQVTPDGQHRSRDWTGWRL